MSAADDVWNKHIVPMREAAADAAVAVAMASVRPNVREFLDAAEAACRRKRLAQEAAKEAIDRLEEQARDDARMHVVDWLYTAFGDGEIGRACATLAAAIERGEDLAHVRQRRK